MLVEHGTLDLALELLEAPRLPMVGPAIPLHGGRSLVIEHVAVRDARAVRGFVGTPFDGSIASRSWNGQVWEYPQAGAGAGVGYAFHGNDGLHVRLADAVGFDAVQIHGGVRADLYAPSIPYTGDTDTLPRHRFVGRTLRSRALFADRIDAGSVSLTHVTDGVIADAVFFRLHDQIPTPAPRQWPLGQTWTPHSRIGLDAIGIEFEAQQAPRELTLIVEDPLDPRLQLMTVDVQVDGSGPILAVLDVIDQVIPPGTGVTVRAVDAQGDAWTDASVRLYTTTPELAVAEALPYRRFLVKTLFACLSEPRPWTGLPREGDLDAWFERHPMGDQLRQLFEAVDSALQLDPLDEEMLQVEQWLYRARRRPELKDPVLTGALAHASSEAPDWARWARATWLTARRVPAWWLDHRLVDGWDGAMFLQEVKTLLEDPTLMFMEMV